MAQQQLSLELDQLLTTYLDQLTRYQTLRTSLSAVSKNAHFDLARAKLALGPERVGQQSWNLGETSSRIHVSQDLNGTYSVTPASPSNSTPDPATLPKSTSTLRSRTPITPVSSSSSPPDTTKHTSEDTEKIPSPPPDPIHQFSSLPPPALRSSQRHFKSLLERTVELTQALAELRETEKKVLDVRMKLEG